MKTEIICVGKIKENYIKEAIETFLARLRPLCKLEVTEIKDSNIKEESKKVLELIKKRERSKIITLSEEGKQFTSIEFSERYKMQEQDLVFIIGGPEGLTKEVKDKSNEVLSLSGMTFLHEMARLFLIEQIYRAQKIIRGGSYHK
ncbi:23S rRNA (pseudouridine(1915)-N(3))-methyltransferase RlmH [Candidatus Woesearchaeota archaeon]|jgi:23S rRNA (pseudouridine1915-N3)-methyltransferase|nr:23S rRNA (pseudouridine(1915)-N(3))-methyltransferase RlmH [Candidatus Woesearchaeota archaeon]MBT6044980.1 23S rRNA (pseudouridine(1915)-N(3))-methyltransferase RlmH [Candidatus Woesearchaeota archaeon]